MKTYSKLFVLILINAISFFFLIAPQRGVKAFASLSPASLPRASAPAKPQERNAANRSAPSTLVYPDNGQTIEDPHQLFTWLPPDPKPLGKVTYQFKIAELLDDQSPQDAACFNAPVFIKENLEQTSIEYPSSVLPLVDGKTFAWQVIIFAGGAFLKESEARTFKYVKPVSLPTDNARIWVPSTPNLCPSCPEGLFEVGNLANEPGWQGATGVNSGSGSVTMNANGFVAGRQTLMACPGTDPKLASAGVNLPTVREGKYSVRLGNSNSGAEAEQLGYTFLVSAAKPFFTFSYAVVLEDPGHDKASQPFFGYRAFSGATQIITPVKKYSDKNDPYFKVANTNLVYKPWDCETIDLSNYIGKIVTIEFTTADCLQGGHYGYAYIDGFCEELLTAAFTMPEKVCPGSPIWMDGTASANETDYFVSVEKSDQWWGRPDPTQEVMHWFTASEAGKVNLTDFYKTYGAGNADKGEFQCNTYYRIKLAVRNHCVVWKETTKLLYINPCPVANAGTDLYTCCANLNPLQIGTPAIPGYTYSWTSAPAGFTSNQAMPTVMPTCTTIYTLTATSPEGCQATDQVKVTVDKPFKVSVSQVKSSDICDTSVSLVANVEHDGTPCPQSAGCLDSGRDPRVTFQWSVGSTVLGTEAVVKVDPSGPTTYTLTVKNACATKTASITVTPCVKLVGAFPVNDIISPNAFTPNGDGLNDTFVITHLGVGSGPAYNATGWRLTIIDRWGMEIAHRTGTGTPCSGVANQAIRWDGRAGNVSGSGLILPVGVYTWLLELQNCSFPNGAPVKVGGLTLVK